MAKKTKKPAKKTAKSSSRSSADNLESLEDIGARHSEILAMDMASTHKRLKAIGNKLAASEGFMTTRGLEAVHLYLVNKHHWLPSQVRAMTLDDLYFCVREDEEQLPVFPPPAPID